jgi:hypothetical protein
VQYLVPGKKNIGAGQMGKKYNIWCRANGKESLDKSLKPGSFVDERRILYYNAF